MLEEALKREGYRISRAYSGTEAVLYLSGRKPDLILLDLMLPGLGGEEVLPRIKEIPVIVVSARADIDSRVSLLLDGASDYITKPFDLRELTARVAVRLRERKHSESGFSEERARRPLSFGEISLDPSSRSVTAAGEEVHLTRTEYGILKLLLERPSQVITKSFLLEHIGEESPDCTESSLKMHVSNLRKKLREKTGKDHIEAVWGIGFKMREEK